MQFKSTINYLTEYNWNILLKWIKMKSINIFKFKWTFLRPRTWQTNSRTSYYLSKRCKFKFKKKFNFNFIFIKNLIKLQKALQEAEKNASLLTEYHELYELQRKRLENTIKVLIEERDLWIKTSYSISYKVTQENKLNSAKRMNIAEKAWSKLGKHLSILLSDRDTKDLIEIQKIIENWKQLIDEIRIEILGKENELKKSLFSARGELVDLKKLLKLNSL